MELLIVAGLFALLALFVVTAPFLVGEGGFLQDASSSDSERVLTGRQEAILQRWIKDELAASKGEISNVEWNQRQRYLTSRYVDFARRISWLKQSEVNSSEGESK